MWIRLSARPFAKAFEQWRCWLAWDSAACELSQRTLLMHRLGCRIMSGALGRNHGQALRHALLRWRQAHSAELEADRLDCLARKVCVRLQQSRALGSFIRWTDFLGERRHMKKLVCVAV